MYKTIANFIITQKKYFWFILVRILSFLVIGFETFFGPKIVGLEAYGIIEYEKQLINLSTIFLFGLHTGYSIRYYKSQKKEESSSFLLSGFFHILIFFGLYSLISQTFSFGIIVFLLSVLIEQILKIKNKFNLAILFKPIFSIILVIYYLHYYLYSGKLVSFIFDVNLIYFLAFLFFFLFVRKYVSFNLKKLQLSFENYKLYFKNGFQPNLTSSLVLILFFVDRFLIEKYYEESLGVYSIAYNFAVISFLIASSVGYVTTIKIGEKLNEFDHLKELVTKLMKLSYFYISLVILFSIPIIYYINANWFKIEGFEKIALINLIGKTFFGAATFYTSIIYYKNKEYFSWGILLIVTLLITIADFYIIHFGIGDFIMIQYVSNSLLVIYCILINYVVRKKILKKEK